MPMPHAQLPVSHRALMLCACRDVGLAVNLMYIPFSILQYPRIPVSLADC